MKLSEYLRAEKISQVDFAAKIGVPVTTLHGWCSGRRLPGAAALSAIEKETAGAVRVRDFVDSPMAEPA